MRFGMATNVTPQRSSDNQKASPTRGDLPLGSAIVRRKCRGAFVVPCVAKTLCDWNRKDIEKHFDLLCEITSRPRYSCLKCAASAHESKHLCKPRRRIGAKSDGKHGKDNH